MVIPSWLPLALAVLLVAMLPWGWRQVGVPVKIMAVGYVAFGVGAVLLYSPSVVERTGPNSVVIDDYFKTSAWLVIGVMSIFAACVFLGAQLARILLPMKGSTPSAELHLRLPPVTLWFAVVSVVAAVVGIGPATVLNSPAYLYSSGSQTLLKLSTVLLPLATVVAAVVFYSTDRKGQRAAAGVLLASIELLQFGQDTRSFSLFFALVFVGGWLTGRWNRRQTVVRAVIAGGLALLTVGVPLGLRGLPEHGLIPAFHYLVSDPGQFFSGSLNPLSNVLVGVPVSLYVWRSEPAIDGHALWTSINPAPGSLTDWPTLFSTLRVNIYEPYPALGELLNHGWPVAIMYTMAVGAVLETLTMTAGRCRGQWAGAVRLAVTGTAALLLVRSTQYNLRTESRFVYYLIFGVVAMVIASRVTSRGHAKTGG